MLPSPLRPGLAPPWESTLSTTVLRCKLCVDPSSIRPFTLLPVRLVLGMPPSPSRPTEQSPDSCLVSGVAVIPAEPAVTMASHLPPSSSGASFGLWGQKAEPSESTGETTGHQALPTCHMTTRTFLREGVKIDTLTAQNFPRSTVQGKWRKRGAAGVGAGLEAKSPTSP